MMFASLLVAALAVHSYERATYGYTDDKTEASALLKSVPQWARGPFSSRYENGSLEVPKSGRWTFRAVGQWKDEGGSVPCGIRIEDTELELTDGQRSLPLTKGRHAFRVYWPKWRTKREQIEWKGPGDKDFAPIPDGALSHTPADAADACWQVQAAKLTLVPSHEHVRRYETTIDKPGFYRLRTMTRGQFKWGSVTPYHLTFVLDGTEERTWYSTDGRGGIFDETDATVYLTKGRHVFELRGSNVAVLGRWFGGEAFNHDQRKAYDASKQLLPRVWLDKACDRPYVLDGDLKATSVYRLGETVAWNFTVPRSDAGRSFDIRVRALRGATSNEVWRGSAKTVAAGDVAKGRVAFPPTLVGAFEYEVVETADGRVLEGPWEFLVVDPAPPVRTKGGVLAEAESGVLVDSVDCAEEKSNVGSEHRLRDNDTSVVRNGHGMNWRETGSVMRYGAYGPNKRGMTETDWFAVTLKVAHPGKAHLLVAEVPTDMYRRNVIELIDTVTGYYNGALYETRVTEKPGFVKMTIPFWPNGKTLDVLVTPSGAYHGMAGTCTAVGKISLYEYPNGFAPMPEAAAGWRKDRTVCYSGEQGDLGPEKATTPLPWNDGFVVPTARNSNYYFHYDYKAYFEAWDRYAEYAAWNGDTRLIWPIHSYDMAHVKTKRLPWGSEIFCNGLGFRDNDKYTRDTAKLILLACERHNIEFVGDIQLNSDARRWGGTIRDLTGVDTNEVERMFLSDGKQYPANNLNPAHPLARQFLVGFYEEIAQAYGKYPAFKGIAIRNLSWATSVGAWFHNYTVGYDAYTVSRFSEERGIPVVGETRDARYKAITGDPEKLKAWFDWRTDKTVSLRKEILAAVRRHAPSAVLLVKDSGATTPACGAGLDAVRLGHDCGFGFVKGSCARTGIENNEFEPVRMARFDIRDGVEKIPAEKKYDFRHWYGEGVNTAGAVLSAPYATEGFARALAEQPLDLLTRGTYWCLPPGEQSIREFIRAWRAIPSGPARRVAAETSDACAVWAVNAKKGCGAYVVSLSERPLDVLLPEATHDLVSGERVSDGCVVVPPFGLRFVLCEREPKAFVVRGGRQKEKTVAFRGKPKFAITTNGTWSVERPYRLLVSDGTFDYGFTDHGLTYLAHGGKTVFRGVARQGDGSPSSQPLWGLCWYVPKVLSVKAVSAERVEVILSSSEPTDIMTEVTAPDYGSPNFATGFEVSRTYALAWRQGTVAMTDVFSWKTNPGLQVKNWGGFNTSFRNPWEGSEPIEVTAFATVDKEKFAGFRTAKWNATKKKMEPWLGWSVPWAEVWNAKTDTGFDLATDPRDNAALSIGESMHTRFDHTVDSAGPGQMIIRRYLRIPLRRQKPEELAEWYRTLR